MRRFRSSYAVVALAIAPAPARQHRIVLRSDRGSATSSTHAGRPREIPTVGVSADSVFLHSDSIVLAGSRGTSLGSRVTDITTVPEPASTALITFGLALLGGIARYRRS